MRFLRLYELRLTLLVVRRHFSTEAEKVDFRPTRMHVPACMEHNFKTSFGDPPQALLGEQETRRTGNLAASRHGTSRATLSRR